MSAGSAGLDGVLSYGMPHEQWYADPDADREMWVQYRSDDLSVQASFRLVETSFGDGTTSVDARMFSDAWVLWRHLPGLFAALAEKEPKTLAEAAEVVAACGGVDVSAREHPGRQGPALAAVREFQRMNSPDNARAAAEALMAFAAGYEEVPF